MNRIKKTSIILLVLMLAVLMAAWRGVVNTIKRQVELEKGVRTGE